MEDSLPRPVYLLCLTTAGGVPLFTRTKGVEKQLAFAEIGMLYGVQMFAQNHDVELQSTTTENSRILWKVFCDSITLILVVNDDDDEDLHHLNLLNQVFNAMVFFVGLDSLENIKNVERLRKDLKCCYPVVDSLLGNSDFLGSITNSVDVSIFPDYQTLQDPLEMFVNSAGSTHGCIHSNGYLVCATNKWWTLTGSELNLLAIFIRTLPENTASDVPVYLPDASPKIPHRLLSIHLLSGIVVSVMCGPTPSLEAVKSQLVEACWLPHVEVLRACLNMGSRNVPASVEVDQGVIGLLFINYVQRKCLATVQLPKPPGISENRLPSYERRLELLSCFYRNTVGAIFPPIKQDETEIDSPFTHTPKETYMCGLEYKAYAIDAKPCQLFVLYASSVPQYALRSLSQKLFSSLKKEKMFSTDKKGS
ncbi:protein fuzzy homolog [Anneissia japonica]|uniref:protein fuzzy homolog n=1 Tax=Anneissia japonica TaxID=1529436 RepID=UPI0014256277|nr:protein fuzzy homolog [Anneissia japonica]